MLSLPGKVLDTCCISQLNTQSKFRDRGNKEGAVAAMKYLEESGLGVVHMERANRGTSKVNLHKMLGK